MKYWIDLFTGTTWKEFQDAGSKVSGFRHRMRNTASKVQSGDILLAYVTGVMRWVGALEVIQPSKEKSRIWKDAEFPIRFDVKPLILLAPVHGIPMKELEGKVEFYEGPKEKGKFKGFVRASLSLFKRKSDGDLIMDLLRKAQENPISRPVDPKKLARKPLYLVQVRKGKTSVEKMVSVPGDDEENETECDAVPSQQPEQEPPSATRHTEIQYHLLKLGSDMGLDVWVAKNDRTRKYGGALLGAMPSMIQKLPTQFNDATNRIIELIDVLWLKNNTIVAAFEVECTTSVYSGLLRMSDLLALQPNIDIPLYLVAPDERRNKVEQEILRPTFSIPDRPLSEVCGFLPFSVLMKKVNVIRENNLASSIKPDFLHDAAEYFGGGDE